MRWQTGKGQRGKVRKNAENPEDLGFTESKAGDNFKKRKKPMQLGVREKIKEAKEKKFAELDSWEVSDAFLKEPQITFHRLNSSVLSPYFGIQRPGLGWGRGGN